MQPIHTPRLTLLPLTPQQLAYFPAPLEPLEAALGLRLSRTMLTEPVRRAIGIKQQKLARMEAADHAWSTYWVVVVTAESVGAGMIGFKGAPNKRGRVEIGYGIDPDFRGRGYTTEAARALIEWALAQPTCRHVIAWVDETNHASLRVVQKLGMRRIAVKRKQICWQISAIDWDTDKHG